MQSQIITEKLPLEARILEPSHLQVFLLAEIQTTLSKQVIKTIRRRRREFIILDVE